MASAAEIANDMRAHARFWATREKRISALCMDAANVIEVLRRGDRLDGRTVAGLRKRLSAQAARGNVRVQGWPNFGRALRCVDGLAG